MTSEAVHLVDHLFRTRAGQMVAYLTRIFGPAHMELAEEVVQDALVKALQQWPHAGIPDNPGGWLFRVARNGALDALRRDKTLRAKAPAIIHELTSSAPDLEPTALDAALKDDEVRMVFMCCHPELPRDARVALSLKTVGGFSVTEIARAFLVAETAVAQRLARAKRQVRELGLEVELPSGAELHARLDSVLEVIYLMFNEGYNAHGGDDLIRLDFCREAVRLGKLVADSPATSAPAACALVSLMAFQAARFASRVDAEGEMVLLEDQDRALWDRSLIALGFRYLDRSAEGPVQTAYHLQAAIAAIHAHPDPPTGTDWPRILELYDELLALTRSPVVALNRAVALARVFGAEAGLEAIDRIATSGTLSSYYLLPSIKGRLLFELGRASEAAVCYRAALTLPCSEPERRFLTRQLARATGHTAG